MKGLLLIDDESRLDYLLGLSFKKEANPESQPLRIYNRFDKRDLEPQILQLRMVGADIGFEGLCVKKVNDWHSEYCLSSYEFSEKDGLMILSGEVKLIKNEQLSIIREIKYLNSLKGKAMAMIRDVVNITDFDFRNIIIDDGVWIGERLKNEHDARLLGDLVKKEKIMSKEQYENNLLHLKK